MQSEIVRDFTVYDSYRAAVNHLIKKTERRNFRKKDLARYLKCSPEHLSAVLAGRKNFGLRNQEKTAEFFRMSYSEFIWHGERLITGDEADPYPWEKQLDKYETEKEKASHIFQRTGECFGLESFTFFNPDSVENSKEESVEKFIKRKIGTTELFHKAWEIMENLRRQLG